jgi:hypothetical protein
VIDPTLRNKYCKKARRYFLKSQEKCVPCGQTVKEALRVASNGDSRKYQRAIDLAFSVPMIKRPNILQIILSKIIGWFTKLISLTKIKNRVPVPFKL